jgi:hypothetical protein
VINDGGGKVGQLSLRKGVFEHMSDNYLRADFLEIFSDIEGNQCFVFHDEHEASLQLRWHVETPKMLSNPNLNAIGRESFLGE